MIEHLDLHHFKALQHFSNQAIAELLVPRFTDECESLEDLKKCARKNKELCKLLGVELDDLRLWSNEPDYVLELKNVLEKIGFKGTVHEAMEQLEGLDSVED